MKLIKVKTINNYYLPAVLLKENDPRIAYYDGSVVIINNSNEVIGTIMLDDIAPEQIKPAKCINAITVEDLQSLGYEITTKSDSLNLIHTNPYAKRSIEVNTDYVGFTAVGIYEDGHTRCVFNGHVRSLDELKFILELTL